MIFAGFRPVNAVLAALLFGFVTALGFAGQARSWPIAAPIRSMLPYLGIVAPMIVPVVAVRRMRFMPAPAALAKPRYRDLR